MADGKIRIYGAGGCGTNIAYQLVDSRDDEAIASFKLTFIDTSRSNLRESISLDNTYILEDLDGSGKVRKENSVVIDGNIRQILVKFPAEDFNIVIFSASGGSGSVIGPLLIRELLRRHSSVVALVVGSEESVITTQNTVNTLKSLDAIAKQVGHPVVTYFQHLDSTVTRKQVDTDMMRVVYSLGILASKNISEMDTMDIKNFLQYERSTSLKPSITGLRIFDNRNPEWDKVVAISMAAIFRSPEENRIPVVPEYVTVGYLANGFQDVTSIFYVTDPSLITLAHSKLDLILKELIENRDARVLSSGIVTGADRVEDNGLVL